MDGVMDGVAYYFHFNIFSIRYFSVLVRHLRVVIYVHIVLCLLLLYIGMYKVF